MKLKVLDQLHVSAIQPDSLRPGQEIEVGDALGVELLKKHPTKFQAFGGTIKARAPHPNKAAPPLANKAES